jgi:hypothetical protein
VTHAAPTLSGLIVVTLTRAVVVVFSRVFSHWLRGEVS